MTVAFRQARATDAAAARRCIAAAYAGFAAAIDDLPDVTAGVAEDIAAGRVWLAADAGRVLGVLVLSLDAGPCRLTNVAVHPDARGRGLGGRLIAMAEDRARKAGASRIALTTHAAMPDNVALYRHLGWAVTGADGHRVFMAKEL